MNIHFNNRDLFNSLKSSALETVSFGSKLYNLETDSSDSDVLYIHAEASNLKNSFIWEHHQLQFKDQNIDHIFTSLQLFLRNLMTGDSTINFEVLHSEEFKNGDFKFLYDFRHEFYNYNIIKSYLGLAKRDLKQVQSNSFINYKKLSHAYRGIVSAEAILNKNYDNLLSQYQDDYKVIKSLKVTQSCGDVQSLINSLELRMNNLRDELNIKLNQRTITRVLSVNSMGKLDSWLDSFAGSENYLNKQAKLTIDKNLYYEVLEEGLRY